MRILLIGGTRFIGRHVAEAALARGHDLTVFHRGRSSGAPLRQATGSGSLEIRHGDRDSDDDLAGLAGGWDATVDTCAYVPRQVQRLADALGERAGHYLLVSSVSAYATPERAGFTEDAPLAVLDDPAVEEVTEATYGGLKALCERAAAERFGPSTLIVRPTYVVGPDDYTWRFPWWVTRLARGGRVLAPGPASAPMQVIDVRDMAAWIVGLLEDGAGGAFHAASPPPPFTWGELLSVVADAVAPPGTELVWVEADALRAAGVDESALPLWSAGDPQGLAMTADPARAAATGLRPRPLADTARDTLAWASAAAMPPGTGLAPQREAELLATQRS